MTLYMIGTGLWDEKDISVKGLEAIKNCSEIYLESYTSKLNCTLETLERFYGKKINEAGREFVEGKTEYILDKAEKSDIALLVIGDPFCATTHTAIRIRAFERNIPVRVIHNASIINSVGITGLELYKFGKITSIPFDNKNIRSPYQSYEDNKNSGLHTLFLLDLKPDENRFMTISHAIEYLIRTGLDKYTLCIGCAGVGSDMPEIKAKSALELLREEFTLFPQCLIIPGNLHFIEEEALKKLC
ncbi:diphthine synthase [Candidatus Woesearchaeota archaeon]|nr:diphthine synthase [Candidatus Woesearchaeota archaeon]